MTKLKFQIDGVNYQATWNPNRKLDGEYQGTVDIQRAAPDGSDYEFYLQDCNIIPAFDWTKSNDHRVQVDNFLKHANLYDVVRTLDECERAVIKHERDLKVFNRKLAAGAE